MRRVPRSIFVPVVCLLLLMSGLSGPGISRAAIKPSDPDGGTKGPNPPLGSGNPGSSAMMESVLISVAKPYGPVIDTIQAAGGTVTRQYRNFNGIAARIPRTAIQPLSLVTSPGAITKDLTFPIQAPEDKHGLRNSGMTPGAELGNLEFESVEAIATGDMAAFAAANPDAYLVNNATTHVNTLHADGFAGQGMVVAVIDSGIRPGFPHISLDGSVIGCENFLNDGNGCVAAANDGHGTFVAGMISANVVFSFSTTSTFFRATNAYLPGAIIAPNRIPMIGSAPLSSIYALRVCNGGCPNSAILAAMDRAIDLREMYDAGTPGGVNIKVANMSLGGPTLFAGHDIFDAAADSMMEHDILLATSAGNAGPSGLTSGTPAGAFSSLSVGAASIAGYERIVRDLQFGFGIGGFYRPTTHIQTASFSSRGPFADGRQAPLITSNGDWDYGQGFAATNVINFASGTSFSSPNVAGIAAVLRQAFPAATSRQIYNALVGSANPTLLGDGSGPFDMGSGFVDAAAARALLATGTVPDALPVPPVPVKSVKSNVTLIAGLPVLNGPSVAQSIGPLKPGQRGEIIYEVTPNTSQVVVTINNFAASLPPAQQNVFFGDDIYLTVHSAKTSRQPGTTGYFVQTFTKGGQWILNNPEFGLIRITLNGDSTNAGEVSADVSLTTVTDPTPQLTEQGKIHQGDVLTRFVTIPAGTASAEFRLLWREGYSHYPANDLDMILTSPSNAIITSGATLSDPERAVIANPAAGDWKIQIFGFTVNGVDDKYELRVSADGNVLH